jgi:hypothetical protein
LHGFVASRHNWRLQVGEPKEIDVRRRVLGGVAGVLLALGGVVVGIPGSSPVDAAPVATGPGDATVVAVIDSAFSPYHWDYLASKMPQATNADPDDDLPLDRPPTEWLSGFPASSSFASFDALNLTLDSTDPNRDPAELDELDAAKWETVQGSNETTRHYYWMPGTKVIGAMTFDVFDVGGRQIHGTTASHGTGTTSVSVGNLNGTCPECLLVFLQYGDSTSGEAALSWAMSQPWIDVITNSYGFSFPVGEPRTRIYTGTDTTLERAASIRGQSIFFSAGNGLENGFVVPNTTYLSSQEGPDWVVTVGAVSSAPGLEPILPDHASFTGHGKPADIASIGDTYPSAYDSPTVSGRGEFGFSGTSNATPVIAGTYGRALYLARRNFAGASRSQAAGVIARGGGFACGAVRPACELGDGALSATELRTRLFHGAVHTPAGMTVGGIGPSLPPVGEDELLNEGYGSYFAREIPGDDAAWLAEFDRILGPLEGRAKPLGRPAGERDWMLVDSWCRQHIWGNWAGGAYRAGGTLPPSAPLQWPVRTAILGACPALQPFPIAGSLT